jgi:hypothetical protein
MNEKRSLDDGEATRLMLAKLAEFWMAAWLDDGSVEVRGTHVAETYVLLGLTCRRCTDCAGLSHHWMVQSVGPDGRRLCGWTCKHCEFFLPDYIGDEPETAFQEWHTAFLSEIST